MKLEQVKRAVDYRRRIDEAKGLLSVVKAAADKGDGDEGERIDYTRRRMILKSVLMSLIGAHVGANVAAYGDASPGKGALWGAGIGAAAGMASGALRRWAGMDPIALNVSQVKR